MTDTSELSEPETREPKLGIFPSPSPTSLIKDLSHVCGTYDFQAPVDIWTMFKMDSGSLETKVEIGHAGAGSGR